MTGIDRRRVLGGFALAALPGAALSDPIAQTFAVEADEGPVIVARYAANRSGRRASVILLHGSRGFELRLRAYERYADALTAAGIDACLLHFYTAADVQRMGSFASKERREAYEGERYAVWARRVSSTITAILARDDSSGRLGMLGFSLGGFVAAAAAARDERVSALAVLYGGMPDSMAGQVKRMPPMIELHGEADQNVRLTTGAALVELARSVGAPAEQVKYPGKGHGFDFADNDPAATDAVERVCRFFETRIGSA